MAITASPRPSASMTLSPKIALGEVIGQRTPNKSSYSLRGMRLILSSSMSVSACLGTPAR